MFTYVSTIPNPEPPVPQFPSTASDSGLSPSSSYGVPASQYGPAPLTPIVHKHVYVHVAPPEPEYTTPR